MDSSTCARDQNSGVSPQTQPDTTTRRDYQALDWEEAFFAALCEHGNVTRACEAAHISRSAVYARKEEDAVFSALWIKARAIGGEALRDEAQRRAVDGWDEPVFYKGQLQGYIRKFSDTLLIRLLEATFPNEFRHRKSIEHTGADGEPLFKAYVGVDVDQV